MVSLKSRQQGSGGQGASPVWLSREPSLRGHRHVMLPGSPEEWPQSRSLRKLVSGHSFCALLLWWGTSQAEVFPTDVGRCRPGERETCLQWFFRGILGPVGTSSFPSSLREVFPRAVPRLLSQARGSASFFSHFHLRWVASSDFCLTYVTLRDDWLKKNLIVNE